MTDETGKTQPTWEEYYRAKHDALTHTLGKLETIDRRKYDPVEWDAGIIKTCRDLLDLLNVVRKEVVGTGLEIKHVEDRMVRIAKAHIEHIDKQDAALKSQIEEGNQEIKRSLEAMHLWIKNWEPLLNLVRIDYYDKLERVGNIDQSD